MAQKTVVTYECDLDGDEGTETVHFSFDGAAYEIDVCAKHAKELREKFGTYTDHARRATATSGPGRGHKRPRKDTQDVRAWAKEQGITLSSRGRIPGDVLARYNAAH